MFNRENYLRAVRFENPDVIPMLFHINDACWHHYDQEQLKDLVEAHPLLFPGYERPAGKVQPEYLVNAIAASPYTDPWGCVWSTTDDGIVGSVHQHPLADWSHFDDYCPPDPSKTDGTYWVNWQSIRDDAGRARAAGELVQGGLPHGHTFLRLQDIRGYQNVIFDMMDEDPRFIKLLGMVEEFNYRYILESIDVGPDVLSYPEDLGMQVGPMLSPELFRKYIKPVYQRCMKPARDKGIAVHMHSDGDIRLLADDLIEGGVEIINLQDLVNGIDWIAEKFAGKVCVELDIDRQRITRFGTPEDIDSLVREEIEKLSTPQGGLTMVHGMYPGVPIENVKALMDAMERYMGHHRRGVCSKEGRQSMPTVQ